MKTILASSPLLRLSLCGAVDRVMGWACAVDCVSDYPYNYAGILTVNTLSQSLTLLSMFFNLQRLFTLQSTRLYNKLLFHQTHPLSLQLPTECPELPLLIPYIPLSQAPIRQLHIDYVIASLWIWMQLRVRLPSMLHVTCQAGYLRTRSNIHMQRNIPGIYNVKTMLLEHNQYTTNIHCNIHWRCIMHTSSNPWHYT